MQHGWWVFQMFGLATVSKYLHNFSDNWELNILYIYIYIYRHTYTHISNYRINQPTNFMVQSPSWEANSSQLVNKYPTFYRTRWVITAFTRSHHLSLSWARSNQPMPPHPTSWQSILIFLILYSYLCPGLPSGLFPSGLSSKTLYASLLSHIRATCLTHLILLDLHTHIHISLSFITINYYFTTKPH